MAQVGAVRNIVNLQLDRLEALALLDALGALSFKTRAVCELEEKLAAKLNPAAA